MNQRENLLSLLHRKGYERAPVEFMMCPSLVEDYRKKTGSTDYQSDFDMPWRRLPDLVPDDTGLARFEPYHRGRLNPNVTVDEWGVGHESTPTSLHMTKMLFPLADADSVEQIQSYPLPTYSAAGNPQLAAQTAALHRQGLASVGNMQCTVWETAWYLRGMENLMMDMMGDDDIAASLLERVTEMSIQRALLYAGAGVDILFLGDDIGMQQSIMMSGKLYKTWLQPRLKRVIHAAKQAKPGLLVFYHSCGYIEPFIPDLIDAGIDVLNPVQPECMDFKKLHGLYGDVLSFHGCIGTQTTMPFGTPQEVKDRVKACLDIAGPKGGLFVAPTHLLEPEVPLANIYAYAEACQAYTS